MMCFRSPAFRGITSSFGCNACLHGVAATIFSKYRKACESCGAPCCGVVNGGCEKAWLASEHI
jgi:hypothetical protein